MTADKCATRTRLDSECLLMAAQAAGPDARHGSGPCGPAHCAARITPRTAAFIPGESPPLVITAIFFSTLMQSSPKKITLSLPETSYHSPVFIATASHQLKTVQLSAAGCSTNLLIQAAASGLLRFIYCGSIMYKEKNNKRKHALFQA